MADNYKQELQKNFNLSSSNADIVFNMLYPVDSGKYIYTNLLSQKFINQLLENNSKSNSKSDGKSDGNETLGSIIATAISCGYDKLTHYFDKILTALNVNCKHVIGIKHNILYVAFSPIQNRVLEEIFVTFDNPNLYLCIDLISKLFDIDLLVSIIDKEK